MGPGTGVMFLLVGLAYPVVGLLVLAEAIRMLVVSLTRPRGYRPHPACSQCGYSVTGLAGLQCPECGNDLRTVGIITPRMEARRRGSTWGAIAAWTVLVGLVGMILGQVVFMTVGIRAARSSATVAASGGTAGVGGAGMTSVTETLTPASGAYGPVATTVSYTTMGTGAAAGGSTTAATLSVRDSAGRTLMFTANTGPGGGTFYWTDGLGQMKASGTGPKGADVLAWLKAAGADTTATGVAEEADELAALADSAAALTSAPMGSTYTGTRFTAGGMNTSYTAMPQFGTMFDDLAIYALVMVAVTLVVWGLGLWFIIARRRRMCREAMGATVG